MLVPVSILAGVLILWVSGVYFVLDANRTGPGWPVLSVAADALGWPWVMVPWREWLTRAPQGSHRLAS